MTRAKLPRASAKGHVGQPAKMGENRGGGVSQKKHTPKPSKPNRAKP